MKKDFVSEFKGIKKNHVMIGALALMIAVAGYLNFTAEKVDDKTVASLSTEDNVLLDISEEDLAMANLSSDSFQSDDLSQNLSTEDLLAGENLTASAEDIQSMDEAEIVITGDYLDEEMAELLETSDMINTDEILMETASGNLELENMAASGESSEDLTIQDTPGEAVFTSGSGITSLASARLLKEQTRAQNREALMSVINSESADEASRQQATESMIELTQRAEKESAAEILLEAKGYSEVVVSISEDSADVVVGLSTLSDEQCAQIIDAVSRKTEIPASNIIITPAGASK